MPATRMVNFVRVAVVGGTIALGAPSVASAQGPAPGNGGTVRAELTCLQAGATGTPAPRRGPLSRLDSAQLAQLRSACTSLFSAERTAEEAIHEAVLTESRALQSALVTMLEGCMGPGAARTCQAAIRAADQAFDAAVIAYNAAVQAADAPVTAAAAAVIAALTDPPTTTSTSTSSSSATSTSTSTSTTSTTTSTTTTSTSTSAPIGLT